MTTPDPLEPAIEAAWRAAQNNGWRSHTDAPTYAVDRVAVGAMVRAAAPVIAAQAEEAWSKHVEQLRAVCDDLVAKAEQRVTEVGERNADLRSQRDQYRREVDTLAPECMRLLALAHEQADDLAAMTRREQRAVEDAERLQAEVDRLRAAVHGKGSGDGRTTVDQEPADA